MAEVLSQDEIDALLSGANFDEMMDEEPAKPAKSSAKPKSVAPMSIDVSQFVSGSRRCKPVVTLHEYLLGDEKYYTEPGDMILHIESHAREVFDFDSVQHIIRCA